MLDNHHHPQTRETSLSVSDGESSILVEKNDRPQEDINSGPPKGVLLALKFLIGTIFFVVFLVSSVLSKLSLLSLTGHLRSVSMLFINDSGHTDATDEKNAAKPSVVTMYWQLLIILIVPNFVTFLRCLFFGFLGKTRKNFPWPTKGAVLMVNLHRCEAI